MKNAAEASVLFPRGAQLDLRFNVLQYLISITVLDLDESEVNATLESTEIFGSVLSGEGGSAGGTKKRTQKV